MTIPPDNKQWLFPIKGYLQEARTYLSYPFLPKQKIEHKFVIFCIHRSGSSLLANLLDSHPLIHCEDELLYHRKFYPINYLETRGKLSPKENFGFKLMPNHIGYQGYDDPYQFILSLYDKDFKFIKLSRRDLFRAAISLLAAQKRRKFHYSKNERSLGIPKITLPPSQVKETTAWFQNLTLLQDQVMESLPYLELFYEDHLIDSANHQSTVDSIVDFLGIPRAHVHTNFAKISSNNISDHIENIKEIEEYIASSDQ